MNWEVRNALNEMSNYVCRNICKFEPDELDDPELDELVENECAKCPMWQFQ